MTSVIYRTVDADGFNIFYREAGSQGAPKLLLLHGFPSSSHMFRDLIPLLADRFHIVAPDLPGFGNSDMPGRGCTFDRIAERIDRFTEIVGFDRYAVYVFDYGAPTGFRLAVRHPDRITAIISQNGNAYEEGLSEGWKPIRAYWQDASPANREALRDFLKPETTAWQYTHGVDDAARISPDGYSLDNFYLSRPGADEVQLDLFGDYKSTSRSTRPSSNISGTTSRPSWRYGARTIRSSCPPGPRRSSAISPARRSDSSRPDTSHWRPTPSRSRRPSAISSPSSWPLVIKENRNVDIRRYRDRGQPGHRPGLRHPPRAGFPGPGPGRAQSR
jgi:pimeloyl-ACP methyl ester carboxylesterase